MYSDNQKISLRQTFRLFFFDFMGISTIVLPSSLAEQCGVYGFWSIALGGGLGILYLFYLSWCSRQIGTDLLSYLSDKEWGAFLKGLIGLVLSLLHILIAGFTGAVLSGMIRQSLIKEESYAVILVLTLILAGYAIRGGLESRARVYEVLFWFVIIPLLVMLALSVKGIDFAYFSPQIAFDASKMAGGGYLVFLTFGTMFSVLFLPGKVAMQKGSSGHKRLTACVAFSFVGAIAVLTAVYFLLIGNFGQRALGQMRYPVITLMSTIQWKGGFLKRLDAIMMGVWFFTVFALLNLNLYYGANLLECVGKKLKKNFCHPAVLILAFLVGMITGYWENAWNLFTGFFWYVQTPLYVILPGVLASMEIARKKKHKAKSPFAMSGKFILLLAVSLFTTGCAAVELEDKSFPLLVAVQVRQDTFEIIYDPAPENKVLDYNHVKVMVFEKEFLENPSLYEGLLEQIKEEQNFPRNAYVCVTEDADKLVAAGNLMAEDPGTYVEELLENDKVMDAENLPTIGKLVDDTENRMMTWELAYLAVEKERIVWNGMYKLPNYGKNLE